MKLYEIPRGSHFKVIDEDPTVPPYAPKIDNKTIYKLRNIDGMFSYCTRVSTDELDKTPVHIAAYANVEIVDG